MDPNLALVCVTVVALVAIAHNKDAIAAKAIEALTWFNKHFRK